ncbi:MAG: hypothetical protein AAFX93_20520 [Verrucomicrobiota bacterium]
MKILYSILMCLLIVGCATSGKEINVAQVENIEKGKTTYTEMVEMFGPPQWGGLVNGNRAANWYFMRTASHGKNFIPIYGAFDSSMDVDHQRLDVQFDENDVVENFVFSDNPNRINSGLINANY